MRPPQTLKAIKDLSKDYGSVEIKTHGDVVTVIVSKDISDSEKQLICGTGSTINEAIMQLLTFIK